MKFFRFILLIGCALVITFTSCNRDCDCDHDKPNEFTVLFNSNGGSEVLSQKVKEGEKVIQPDDPKRYGFIFDAWFWDIELEGKWSFETNAVFSDITLYANWMKDPAILNSILYGKWKLTKTAPFVYLSDKADDLSMYDIVYEFQPNGILTVTGMPDAIVWYQLMENGYFNYCHGISENESESEHYHYSRYDLAGFIGIDDQCQNPKYQHSVYISSKTDPMEMVLYNNVPWDPAYFPHYFFSKIK